MATSSAAKLSADCYRANIAVVGEQAAPNIKRVYWYWRIEFPVNHRKLSAAWSFSVMLICINMASISAITATGRSQKGAGEETSFEVSQDLTKGCHLAIVLGRKTLPLPHAELSQAFWVTHWVMRQIPNCFRLRFRGDHWFHVPFFQICLQSFLVFDSQGFIIGQTRM